MKVQHDVDHLTLEVTPEDKDATYEIIGNRNFVYGDNLVTVCVIASDGVTRLDYDITVYKQPDLEDRVDLMELTVDKGVLTPSFNAKQLVYEVDLPYEVEDITVSARALDNTAEVTGTGTYNLNVGLNVITVKVISSIGEEKTYQIKVRRAESDNANLASLSIQNHTISPSFNKDTTSYNVETTLSELVIYATPEQEGATYEIIGNEDLDKGLNQITIRVTAPNGQTSKDYVLKVTKTGSNNNNLAYLAVVGYDLNPVFNKSNLVYDVNVPNNVNSVYLDAVSDDENATVSGIGLVNLVDGKNVFDVIVTSESGKTKTYTVNIYKGLSDNNYLAELEISNGSLDKEFNKLVNEYSITVPYEIDSISFVGYPEDDKANITGNGTYNLNVGENKITLTVISASGIKNPYIINVTRETAVSAKLSRLEDNNGYKIVPNFTQNNNNYMVTVDNEITTLDLIIETLDPNATYVVRGNENFVVGNNLVEIEVTSSDGKLTELYTIQVNRQVSTNNYLSYILPSNGTLTPSFNKTTNNYTVTAENNVTSIKIDAEPEDINATMEITNGGVFDLKVGENKAEIVVTSVIGVKRTYTVNIIRKQSGNNYLKSLDAKVAGTNVEITPAFNKETLKYEINVPAGTTNIKLSGEPEDDTAEVTGLGYAYLVAGENTHLINVKAENGEIRTYEIMINREKSSNNSLIDLIPSCGTLEPSFTYGNTEYNLTLGNADSLLSFEVSTEDRFAEVTGHGELPVPDGESVRKITVTAEDGSKKIYTVNVNRIRTDDARLKSLQVKSFDIEEEFNSDKYEYTLTVPNDKFILTENEIVAVPIYDTTKVFPDPIIELSVLKVNTYQIKTIAADGYTTQVYTINVIRKKSSDSTLQKLAVSGYELTPEFESKTTEYKLALPKGTTELRAEDVLAIPTDQYATVVKERRP